MRICDISRGDVVSPDEQSHVRVRLIRDNCQKCSLLRFHLTTKDIYFRFNFFNELILLMHHVDYLLPEALLELLYQVG